MLSVVLAALLGIASARPQLPAGVSAIACPNYPFCGAQVRFSDYQSHLQIHENEAKTKREAEEQMNLKFIE